MTKLELLRQLTNDCFIYFCRIIACKKGIISAGDIKKLNDKIIGLYDSSSRNIDQCRLQYESLIYELKFVLQVLRENKKIECLEGNTQLRKKHLIQGLKQLDFLVDN